MAVSKVKRQEYAVQIASGIVASPHLIVRDDNNAWLRFTPEQIAQQAMAIVEAILEESED